jgi:alginate O-acetyltransferase complex protein AlgI
MPFNARWFWMWLLAAAIYGTCKMLTWLAAPRVAGAATWRHWAYVFGWPGLDARRFLDPQQRPIRPTLRDWTVGVAKMLIGVLVFWTAQYWAPPDSTIVLGWAGIIGVGLMLHFGLFQLLSCLWRAVGVDARPLMVEPLHSTSVAEFWSNRWNTAFRDLTRQFMFGPLARRYGLRIALVASFFFSGLIHDVVISVPAGGGYGGPTLFFLVQVVAIFVEKSRAGHRLGLGRGWRGWTFTAISLLLPAQLLFHRQFLEAVVLPFMKFLGAA